MFADDTKLYESLWLVPDCAALEADIDSVAAWSYDWLITFNIDMLDQVQKCCVRLSNNSLDLIPLPIWESRTDMVEVYKYLHGHYISPEPLSDVTSHMPTI